MTAIAISLFLDVMFICALVPLLPGAGVAFLGAVLAIKFFGALLVLRGVERVGARVVQVTSGLFFPVGLVGMLGARSVLGRDQPKVGEDSPRIAVRYMWKTRILFGFGSLCLGMAYDSRIFATVGVAGVAFGLWAAFQPAVTVFPRHIVLNSSWLQPHVVIRRKELDDFHLSDSSFGGRLFLQFSRKGKPRQATLRLFGANQSCRDALRSSLETLGNRGRRQATAVAMRTELEGWVG